MSVLRNYENFFNYFLHSFFLSCWDVYVCTLISECAFNGCMEALMGCSICCCFSMLYLMDRGVLIVFWTGSISFPLVFKNCFMYICYITLLYTVQVLISRSVSIIWAQDIFIFFTFLSNVKILLKIIKPRWSTPLFLE